MRRTVRKVLSFILSMCMVLSCITVLGTTTKAAETTSALSADDMQITSTLPEGISGKAYSESLSVAFATGDVTWAVTAGNLPAGLTLSANGTLSGTPTATGTYTFTVTATDSNSATASRTFNLIIRLENRPPYFIDLEKTTLVVLENKTKAKAGTIKARDDEGDSFSYAIVGGSAWDLFDIDSKTGVVTMKNGVEPFDYEEWVNGKTEYTIKVEILDDHAGSFSILTGSDATFTIEVLDANETPYFDYKSTDEMVIEIGEYASKANEKVKFADTDKYHTSDYINNKVIALSGCDGFDVFDVSEDGQISVKNGVKLDNDVKDTYKLDLRVCDANQDENGNYIYPALYSDETFTIKVLEGDSIVTTKPVAAEGWTYNGAEYGLIKTAGAASNGTIKYAVKTDDSVPADSEYTYEDASLIKAKNAGTYKVWYKAFADEGYKDSAAGSVEVTVQRKAVTVTGIMAVGKTYDGTTDVEFVANLVTPSAVHANLEGVVAADEGKVTVSATGAFEDANAGTGKTVTISDLALAGTAAGNYALAASGNQTETTADITQRSVTVTAGDQTVDLNGSIDSGLSDTTVSAEGLLAGDALSAITLTSSSTAHATTSGSITPSGAQIKGGGVDVTGNYDIKYANGTLTVNRGTVSYTAPSASTSLVYDAGEQALVSAGTITDCEGAVMKYALGSDASTAPSDASFGTDISKAKYAGSYTVWYRIDGGNDYEDVAPQKITGIEISKAAITPSVTIADWTRGQAPSDPEIAGNAGNGKVKCEYKKESDDDSAYSETVPAASGDYALRVTIPETTNYFGGTATATFRIVEPRDLFAELRSKIWSAISLGGEQTVYWNKENKLPYDIMKLLEEHPQITLVFEYSYEGKEYKVTMPGRAVKAYTNIPWYGPLYLYAHYGKGEQAVQASQAGQTYLVKRGDVLCRIARRLHTTVKRLVELNGIKNPNRIWAGQVLRY